MTNGLGFEFAWLAPSSGTASERATLAELAIYVDGRCATEIEDRIARTVRTTARLPASRLAEWLAVNWWRLRWEPESNTLSWTMAHNLGAIGCGYVWPNLEFASDGVSVLVRARPTAAPSTELIRYLSSFDIAIPADDFEGAVDGFVSSVIARLQAQQVNESDLSTLWNEVLEERRSPEVAKRRKLEALLGFDADEAPADLIGRLQRQAASYGTDAIEEIAAASKAQAGEFLERIIDAQPSSQRIRIPGLAGLRRRIREEAAAAAAPWDLAERVADLARDYWSLSKDRVPNAELERLFDVPRSWLESQGRPATSPISAGFRSSGDSEEIQVLLRKRHPVGRRFAVARLIADHLMASADRLLPATEAKTGRQKFQRAFAQEFLCPFLELTARLGALPPSDDAIEDAAEYFEVSPLVVKTALVNKGHMPRDVLQN